MTDTLLHVAAADFEAARSLEHLPTAHRAHALHGHSFTGTVRAALPEGWGGFPGGEVDALAAHLHAALAPLDYRHLNSVIEQPGDENLARWLHGQLGLPGLNMVGVRSTRHAGVQLDRQGEAHVWRRHLFQSAHQLPNVAPGHKCGRMHGHGFEVLLHAKPATGGAAAIDQGHLDALWAPLHTQLHLACLNDIPGLDNPTSENIAAWIWQQLQPKLPSLSWVTVHETASCGAQFNGLQHRVWKDFTLDSAVRLKRAPDGDPRRRLHGHTFTLRLHLSAPLDPVMGWTVDFGNVKAQFAPLFERLDHAALHEMMGEHDADTASLARRIMALTTPLMPSLERLDLYETRGCGVILQRGAFDPALPI